jgi:flagellar L-ring protein precursor FlgH
MRLRLCLTVILAFCLTSAEGWTKSQKSTPPRVPAPSPIDKILEDLRAHPQKQALSPGSTYDPTGRLSDVSRDLRAANLNDFVTVVISDHSSASSSGTTSAKRKSQATASITALAGVTRATGPWANLAGATGNTQLDGQGLTNRTSDLTTTLTARVIAVLPNGNLIVEGNKIVQINSEKQKVTIRGIVRWNDITPANQVSSDRLADLEVLIDGRGVVNDALRRPNFLYRMLMSLLPF